MALKINLERPVNFLLSQNTLLGGTAFSIPMSCCNERPVVPSISVSQKKTLHVACILGIGLNGSKLH